MGTGNPVPVLLQRGMKPLTNEELVAEIQNGNSESIMLLWDQCYRYIKKTAVRWAVAWESRPDFDEDDLMQAAFFALYKAVEGFRLNDGCSFIGYLDLCLKAAFTDVCCCRTVRQKKDPLNNALSLDFSPDNGSGEDGDEKATTLMDLMKDPTRAEDRVEDDIFMQQCSEVIRRELQRLPGKQGKAIESYYLDGKTQAEVAEDLQCSRSYVATLVKDGLNNLKGNATLKSLQEDMNYYNDRNLYRNTGFFSWKRTGSSSQEIEVIRKDEMKKAKLKAERKLEKKIRETMERTGWDYEFVKWLHTA